MEGIYEKFKIVSVSSNTNSFGLHGVVILAKSGTAFEIGMGSINNPTKGAELFCKISEQGNLLEIQGKSYEIPRKLPNAPKEVIAEVFKD